MGWDLRRVQKLLKNLSESIDPSIRNYMLRRFPPEGNNSGYTYMVVENEDICSTELLKSEQSKNQTMTTEQTIPDSLTDTPKEIFEMMQKDPKQIFTAKYIKRIQDCHIKTARKYLNLIFKTYPNQIYKHRSTKTGEFEYTYIELNATKKTESKGTFSKPISRTDLQSKKKTSISTNSSSSEKPQAHEGEYANLIESPFPSCSNHLSRTSLFYQHLLKILIHGNLDNLSYLTQNPLGIQFYLRDVLDIIGIVKTPTAFQLLRFIYRQESWFHVTSLHELFIIDLNHLLARAHANKISNTDVRNWLNTIIKNSEISHRIIFFSSYHQCPPESFTDFPGTWLYETNYKDPKNKKLMDVDTYIVSWFTIYIFQYSQEISGIYLFSGDKDLYHVIKTANAFKIPVIIGVISDEDCAQEIRILAKSVHELESWAVERMRNK